MVLFQLEIVQLLGGNIARMKNIPKDKKALNMALHLKTLIHIFAAWKEF